MKLSLTILSFLFIFSCKQPEEKKNLETSEKQLVNEEKPQAEKDVLISQKKYSLNDILVTVTQAKNYNSQDRCKLKLVISRDNILIDSLTFSPEAVGGYYGISTPKRIENHLVFTKHGDYDGRTIIVNDQGQVFNIIGGKNFFDSESKMLFTIYGSDLSGFAVFDLKNDSTIMKMPEIEDRPFSFHKAFGERYFILSSNDETPMNEMSIWEIEFDMERIMKVDIDTNEINEMNILQSWELEDVNCECEK